MGQRIMQGDMYWVEVPAPGFTPPYKRRPCIVVSADNRRAGDVVVVPLTTNRKYSTRPHSVLVEYTWGTGKRSWVKCSQPTTIPASALHDDCYVVNVPPSLLDKVLRQVLLHLGARLERSPQQDTYITEAESEALLMSDTYPPMQPDPLWDDCDTPTWAV